MDSDLPVMPGFREMALRRRAQEQAAQLADEMAVRMAEDRGRLVRELAEQRQAAGLSQTEVAARMGTSQSAVARLEAGTADVRASTLERYAAAVGTQISWKPFLNNDPAPSRTTRPIMMPGSAAQSPGGPHPSGQQDPPGWPREPGQAGWPEGAPRLDGARGPGYPPRPG